MAVRINQGAIDRLLRSPSGPTGQLLTRIGMQVQNRARSAAPVDTGRLRASIQMTPVQLSGSTLTVRVGSNVNYAVWVHEGTRFMSGRPYLTSAIGR